MKTQKQKGTTKYVTELPLASGFRYRPCSWIAINPEQKKL